MDFILWHNRTCTKIWNGSIEMTDFIHILACVLLALILVSLTLAFIWYPLITSTALIAVALVAVHYYL